MNVTALILAELCSVLSRLINVLLGGTADMTYSARAGRDDLKAKRFLDCVCMQAVGEKNHCDKSWEYHVNNARGLLEAHASNEEYH